MIESQIITELRENEVFCFGSNMLGLHVGGAALTARTKFGAEQGVSEGMTGQCYAIPTCKKPGVPFDSIDDVRPFVDTFLRYAEDNLDKTFLMTPIGTGVAGFSEEELDSLFTEVPFNVILLWTCPL